MALALLLALAAMAAGMSGVLQSEETGRPLPSNAEWFGRGWEEDAAQRRDIRQNHRIHVTQEEMECTDCHEGATDEDGAGMPKMDVCADCHDKQTSEVGEDRTGCLFCHTFAQPVPDCTEASCTEDTLPEIEPRMGSAPYRNLRYPGENDERGFSHRRHAEAEVACADCHGDIAREGAIPFPSGKYMPTPQRCLDCHAKDLGRFTHQAHQAKGIECEDCHEEELDPQKTPMPDESYRPPGLPTATPPACTECHEPVSTACETCHVPGTFDKRIPPAGHRGAWLDFHGVEGELNQAGLHGKDCYTCHRQNDCVACHMTEPPRDHTNFWRTRGHGFMAGGNRDRCANCHRQDFCVRCHNETAPRSHIGSWERRHCTWCHLGSGSSPVENCRVCHRQAIHISAPHAFRPGLDCAQCH